MRRFDDVLRQGLMEANLAQYETVLEKLPDWEPDFSPRYLRERTRLLADPWSWVKRRERPMWRQIARNVACVLLACTVAFGALMAVSPTVRASVFGWFRSFVGGEARYNPSDGLRVYQEQPGWRPAWIPEGFHLSDVSTSGVGSPQSPAGFRYHLSYQEDGMSADTRAFTFTCHHSWGGQIGMGNMDETAIETATVWGMEADFYACDSGQNMLIWNGPGGEFFELGGSLDKETLEKIADSVEETDDPPLPEYYPRWLPELAPEGPLPPPTAIRNEAVQLAFQLEDLSTARLLYASPDIGPLWAPEGTTEEETVEVNGLPARFWPAMEPDDGVMGAAIQRNQETGEMAVVGRSISCFNMNTLMWRDPETGISFQLQATTLLPKEDLIRMAESVAAG